MFIDRVGESYLQGILNLHNRTSKILEVDPQYFRPSEVDLLVGDPTKAINKLGWKQEYDLSDLVNDMMQSDIKLFKRDAYLRRGGFSTLNYFE